MVHGPSSDAATYRLPSNGAATTTVPQDQTTAFQQASQDPFSHLVPCRSDLSVEFGLSKIESHCLAECPKYKQEETFSVVVTWYVCDGMLVYKHTDDGLIARQDSIGGSGAFFRW